MQCAKCDESTNDGTKCSQCFKEYCFGCSCITEKGFRNLGTNRRAAWKCPSCKISLEPAEPQLQVTPDISNASLEEILLKINGLSSKLDRLPQLINDVSVMKSEMTSFKESCAKIDSIADRLDGLASRISALETVKDELDTVKASVDSLRQDYINKDQWSRLNNVEIKGVPMKASENLFTIIEELGKQVGCNIPKPQINYVSRIPIHNSKTKSILLSFVNRYVKEDFVSAARAKKIITAADIGLGEREQRIYVNDHLSPQNKMLLNKAKLLAKDKGYQFVWVKFAKIQVRKNESTHTIAINSLNDLNKIV